jgi:hypothetical protein
VVFQQQHHNNKTGHLIILCCVNSPAFLVQNWLTQDKKNSKTQNLETKTKIQRETRRIKKSRDFDSMVKKAGWGDKKIKKIKTQI